MNIRGGVARHLPFGDGRENGRSENKITMVLTMILKNAERRGEVDLKDPTPRIISLPWDLLRYGLITRMEPISDDGTCRGKPGQ